MVKKTCKQGKKGQGRIGETEKKIFLAAGKVEKRGDVSRKEGERKSERVEYSH